jgi:N6-L-threonylcarbamoyladenine synthase/protein kinase Bud32
MIVLAFDTSTTQLACALARVDDNGYELLGSADAPAPRRANSELVGRIDGLLHDVGLARADVNRVVCGRGPGSFTGVRIGISTAKGIASGLHVPLHGVSTLDSLAWRMHRLGHRGDLGVMDDAMRGEIYPVDYQLGPDGPRRLAADTVSKAGPVADRWASGAHAPLFVTGDGLLKYRSIVESAFEEAGKSELLTCAPDDDVFIDGEGLVQAFCALRAQNALDSGDPSALLPLYTRLSDAEENERKRIGARDYLPKSGVADELAQEGLLLRPMSRNDVPYVAAIEREVFCDEAAADAWSESMLADEFEREGRTWWVAAEDGQVVGYAGGWIVDGVMQLLDLGVSPRFQRRGIASKLLRRLTHDALDLGASSMTLEVRENNVSAQSFYRRMGLVTEGIRPHYYPGGMNAYIMNAPLPLPDQATTGASMQSEADSGRVAGMDLTDLHAHREAHPLDHTLILAIESSCDETAAAVIDGEGVLHSDVVASQVDFHARFGGVVPEIASRKHVEAIVGVAEEALHVAGSDLDDPLLDFSDLSAIAVTSCPGLVGALVVGVAFAKGLAWACELPLIEVNHLEGHLYANRLLRPDIEPPLVALLVSGGHTMLVHVRDWGDYETLGQTLDDAAGEAFDKVAKALGLGYPGGPAISRLAATGNPQAIDFPRAMMHSGDLMFSLSGLKTAVITYIEQAERAGERIDLPDLCASFQQAVIDVQVAKAKTALEMTGAREFCIGGGVAANPALREAFASALEAEGVRVTMPPLSACTDNAGMIAAVALERYHAGNFADYSLDARARASLDERY